VAFCTPHGEAGCATLPDCQVHPHVISRAGLYHTVSCGAGEVFGVLLPKLRGGEACFFLLSYSLRARIFAAFYPNCTGLAVVAAEPAPGSSGGGGEGRIDIVSRNYTGWVSISPESWYRNPTQWSAA